LEESHSQFSSFFETLEQDGAGTDVIGVGTITGQLIAHFGALLQFLNKETSVLQISGITLSTKAPSHQQQPVC
jgi:hypothetical protein